MNCPQDTIVAVSTPLGCAARAIVRLSGPGALDMALRRFRPDDAAETAAGATYRAYRGAVTPSRGGRAARVPVDLFLMRAPRSYTREDVVELHVPGSPPVVDELVADLCREGARPAGAGEFTARAFASGRLDLAQAEAVMAVVAASTERSLAAAQRLLEGRLSDEVNGLVDRLRDLLARVELAIDFSQEDVPLVTPAEAGRVAADLRDEVVHLSRGAREVTHLDGDLRVAMVGRPNVGKSSLFNRLAGADRAIVTDVPGTTRDELREAFTMAGSRFVLSDTAGLDDAVADLAADRRPEEADVLARAARARTLSALARAEVVLVVVEAGRMIADAAARDDVRRLLATLAAPVILVANKCDLPAGDTPGRTADRVRSVLRDVAPEGRVVTTSALTRQGLDRLRAAMADALRLGDVDRSSEGPAVSARHRRCFEWAAEALERAVELCDTAGSGAPGDIAPPAGFSEDLLALDLREALDALCGITGRGSPRDVLDEIFARFCIGK